MLSRRKAFPLFHWHVFRSFWFIESVSHALVFLMWTDCTKLKHIYHIQTELLWENNFFYYLCVFFRKSVDPQKNNEFKAQEIRLSTSHKVGWHIFFIKMFISTTYSIPIPRMLFILFPSLFKTYLVHKIIHGHLSRPCDPRAVVTPSDRFIRQTSGLFPITHQMSGLLVDAVTDMRVDLSEGRGTDESTMYKYTFEHERCGEYHYII